MRACIFAHYDHENMVDEYVFYYLQELLLVVDRLLFVTVCELANEDLERLDALGIEVCVRENRGYDFYSYKTGIQKLNLAEIDEILLCNDSVYGPFYDLRTVFKSMQRSNCDIWGITASEEISYHLQSYFLVFRQPAIGTSVFRRFWDEIEVLENKRDIIRKYEVGFSRQLSGAGLALEAYIHPPTSEYQYSPYAKVKNYFDTFLRRWSNPSLYLDIIAVASGRSKLGVNHTHLDWKELIETYQMPFVKIELLRDNPKGLSGLGDAQEVIEGRCGYPYSFISNHLKRAAKEP